jgi:hypothetical protein
MNISSPNPAVERDGHKLLLGTRRALRAGARSTETLGVKHRMLEGIAEAVGRFFLWLFALLFIDKVFYPIGWVMVRVVTVGRYPPPSPSKRTREFIALLPLIVLIVGVTIWFS